ncbi:aerolysin-like protein [Lingula anatina]|uniref:Aerolysin-like protein n=1 Tax=Lingula anatina TaxID=7574 RepID=A0A1S3J1M3_LINAN|nr:aerolysin-like protein [Lingula anatina]|eukprot:XP_013404337.1 aerolysin-like protein [Lingula anatina]
MPYLREFSSIDKRFFTTNQASGGNGGTPFTYVRLDDGAIMTRLKAWKDDWRIRGVEMWMSDGKSHLVGKRSGASSEFRLNTGEKLTKLNIQASGETSSGGNHRLGAIWLQTDKGRDWGIFSRWLEEDGRYCPDMGSGIVCGMFGAGGEDVDSLGFAILHPIKQARLVDVTYPNLDTEIVASVPETVVQQRITNESSVEQTYTLKGSRSVTITRQWGITTALEFSLQTTVSGGIPGVADVGASSTWKVTALASYGRFTTTTEERTWEWPIKCPPNRLLYATGTMYADSIDTVYKANMQIDLQNGNSYKYSVEGIYGGMNARSGSVKIEDLGPALKQLTLGTSRFTQGDGTVKLLM